MIEIDGSVTNVTYQNEENGFAILRFHTTKQEDITIIGTLASLQVGEMLRIKGEFETHSKFGQQFRVVSFEYRRATGIAEIEYMLGSGLIDNVGKKRAADIVNHFKEKTIEILDSDPERIKEVPGIGKKIGDKIVASWKKQYAMRDLMLFLQPYGISLNFVYRIFQKYQEEAKAYISENPYRLIEDMRGVGFKKADAIAQNIGYDKESYRRIKAATIHTLHEAESSGDCYLEKAELIKRTALLTAVDEEKVLFSLDHLKNEALIVDDKEAIYLSTTYEKECNLAKNIVEMISGNSPSLMKEKHVRSWVSRKCKIRGIEMNEEQSNAVVISQKEKIMILTGGPGTGKTTTLKLIIDLFYENGKTVVLAAPTGRAAQKMGEVTGFQGKTIHRLLEYGQSGTKMEFQRNRNNQLEGDIFVIDEFSMVDLSLANALLDAIPHTAHIIFVGDADQLPSVGAGNVLADLIASQKIPLVKLTKIFRQATKSRIVTASHEIKNGGIPKFANKKEDNCFFIPTESAEATFDTVIELVTKRLPKSYNIDPIKDIQVITAMHKGTVGTEELNKKLQHQLNGSSNAKMSKGNKAFAIGDKVMQISNNYELQAFNGDIGTVSDVSDQYLTVEFPAITAKYEKKDIDQLTHAYAISIHKSQGSEFPFLVIPLATQHFVMLKRNLIYTALTRAKKLCVLVGSYEALSMAIKNNSSKKRNSQLDRRIVERVTSI